MLLNSKICTLVIWSAVISASLLVGACEPAVEESAYVTVVADIGDVRDVVPATGRLTAAGTVEVRAPRAGTIAVIHVKEGDRVQSGKVLASLSTPDRSPALDQAVAASDALDASMTEAEITLRAAYDEARRTQTLADKGFVSAAGVRSAELEVERAEAGVMRLMSEQRAAKARIRMVAAEGADADVVALVDGVVTLMTASVGQQVSPDDEIPLFQTSQGHQVLALEIMVAESDLERISLDSTVSFTVDAFPGIRNLATLTEISASPIRTGRFSSYRAMATYDNPSGVLTPGMNASVELIKANSRQVLRIPAQAINFRPPNYLPPMTEAELTNLKREYNGEMRLVRAGAGGGEFGRNFRRGVRLIFVLEDGQPVRREVRIGAETDEFIEVTEGLNPGDVIIVKNNTDPRAAV